MGSRGLTPLGNAVPFVCFDFVGRARLLHTGVAAHACNRQHHGLVKQDKPLGLVDGTLGRLWVVKNDKGLALGAQVRFGDNVDDGAEFGEDGVEGVAQGFWLDALLEVAHVDPAAGGGKLVNVVQVGCVTSSSRRDVGR